MALSNEPMTTNCDTCANDETFVRAEDAPRRERTGLFVVVFNVRDAKRRARVRRLLGSFGFETSPGAFEVPTSMSGARALERAITLELQPEDMVRIYPVCARCRAGTRMWGEGELAGLSPVIVF